MTTTNLPELNEANAPAGTPLTPYEVTFGEREILTYLERTSESIDAYRLDGRARVPPGMLLACYGRLIHESFFYQTGVHVSSDLAISRLPWQDEPLRVAGRIREHFERNGSSYVRFSVEVGTAAGEPLATVEHVSIYKLKPRDAPGAAVTTEASADARG